MKYRIECINGKFYPQYKKFLFWKSFYAGEVIDKYIGTELEYYEARLPTKELAYKVLVIFKNRHEKIIEFNDVSYDEGDALKSLGVL